MHDIEKIYEEYFGAINKYLLCLTHNRDISEELTQETFYRAVEKINSYKGDCEISAWLCRIAKNLWYDQCRKNKKVINLDENDLLNISDVETTESIAVSKAEKIYLYQKMQDIDELAREVVYLRMTGELTFKEIGFILNKTENWARITFYRAKKKLKECDSDET